MQYSMDMHTGTLSFEDAVASAGLQQIAKPDTSHTTSNQTSVGTGILP